MELSLLEQKVRALLIQVAKGDLIVQKPGVISYKELWERVTDEKRGRSRSKKVVDWIVRISAFELAMGRPPLNEIVVPKAKHEPREPLNDINRHLQRKFRVKIPYGSHHEAQKACWKYWSTQDNKLVGDAGEHAAEEGYKQDRTFAFRNRNASIIARRKRLDNHTCQVCGFRLEIDGRYVIDCHHTNPLGLVDAVTVTHIGDLVCLCPTCHRIAHTRRYPLSVEEIRVVLHLTSSQ